MDDISFSEAWLETVAHEKHAINGVLSLGRSERSSLHLSDASVSRRHAVLHRQPDGEFWLVDLGSVNGTYLNEGRIAQPVRLRDGDRITLGSQVFVFRQAEAPPHSTLLGTQATRLDLRAARVWLLLADIVGFTPSAASWRRIAWRKWSEGGFWPAKASSRDQMDRFTNTWATDSLRPGVTARHLRLASRRW